MHRCNQIHRHAYEATVDHTGLVLEVAQGFPSAINDKTIIKFDKTVQSVKCDSQHAEKSFGLEREDGTSFTVNEN